MRSPLLSLLVIGCTSSHGSIPPASELQINDLSVLLPLPANQAELAAALAPTANGVGGPLLPQAVIQGGDFGLDYPALRAVAFRFDPCFGNACENQLRIVWQPLFATTTTPPVVADDAAVHAFYKLTREQLLAAIDEMTAARLDDGGDRDLGPLAPHPIIASEGLDGTLAHSFDAILTKYAGQANLEMFTAFTVELAEGGSGIAGDALFWQFEAFDVAGGQAVAHDVPTLPMASNSMSLAASTNPLSAQLTPATTSSDNLALLADFTMASQAAPGDRQHAFDAALRVLNPRDNSPDTIDCASCHMAQPAVQLVGAQLGMTPAGDTNAFAPDPRIPAADLAATTQLVGSDQALNIHAFSYRTAAPMINQRVINETAANLAYVSGIR